MRLASRLTPALFMIALALQLLGSVPGIEAAKLTLGPAALINNASFGGDVPPEHSYEGTTGYGAGIFFDYYLKDDVALSFQPMYIQKGADLVWTRGEVELARTEIRSNYLSLPIGLKVTGNGSSRMYAHGGLQVDILLDAERTVDGVTENFTDGFKAVELATSFGVGGLIAVGHNYVMVEGRYTQGFSNIAEEDLATASDTTSIKTTGFQLIVGFLFGLGEARP